MGHPHGRRDRNHRGEALNLKENEQHREQAVIPPGAYLYVHAHPESQCHNDLLSRYPSTQSTQLALTAVGSVSSVLQMTVSFALTQRCVR